MQVRILVVASSLDVWCIGTKHAHKVPYCSQHKTFKKTVQWLVKTLNNLQKQESLAYNIYTECTLQIMMCFKPNYFA